MKKWQVIKVAVGLSGGVDSAVSAYLLKEAGYDVVGVHLVCWDEGPACRARDDRKDAVKVALKLGIPMEILDFQKEYKERVIDRFYADYEKGLTPNPDIWCNSEIKFGMFLEWALKNGFDYLATGHYARLNCHTSANNCQTWSLMVPKDEHKDQTYFLHRLTQKELSHVLFPLGELMKEEVREIASKVGLSVARKPDSQGICFIGEIDVHEFLKRRLKEQPGEVVDIKGRVIGRHTGVWFYTIGQRGGWEIAPDAQRQLSNNSHTIVTHGHTLPPMYVVSKDIKKNLLVVGFGAETYRESFQVGDLTWVDQGIKDQRSGLQGLTLQVRIRHGGRLVPCEISTKTPSGAASGSLSPLARGDNMEVILQEPERGIAPGQAAVFYATNHESRITNHGETECLGGGVIQ